MIARPSETASGVVGVLIGVALILYGAFSDGFEFNDLADPEVQGAITTLVGLVAAAVTWWVARRQRDPQDELGSAPDGTVTG